MGEEEEAAAVVVEEDEDEKRRAGEPCLSALDVGRAGGSSAWSTGAVVGVGGAGATEREDGRGVEVHAAAVGRREGWGGECALVSFAAVVVDVDEEGAADRGFSEGIRRSHSIGGSGAASLVVVVG